jgi:hypothetical protein
MKRSLQFPTDSCEDGFRRRYSQTMNGAPNGPGNSDLEPNVEDLEGVLGRFQAWEKTRRDQPNSKNGSTTGIGRGAASRKANLGGGVRELTYEQALRASSYRRPAYPKAAEISPQALKPQAIASPQAELPEVDSATSLHPATAGNAKSAVSVRPPLPEVTRLQASTPAVKPQRTQPAFREVLKGTAGLAATAGTAPEIKSFPLSLRVSDAEQTRIRACAARANLSVSAYLRQCALGVDDLRDQVELALTKLRQQEANAAAPPGLSAIPGILGRFGMHWFRRLRGHHDYTAISLR